MKFLEKLDRIFNSANYCSGCDVKHLKTDFVRKGETLFEVNCHNCKLRSRRSISNIGGLNMGGL